jgi:hypothetical protein
VERSSYNNFLKENHKNLGQENRSARGGGEKAPSNMKPVSKPLYHNIQAVCIVIQEFYVCMYTTHINKTFMLHGKIMRTHSYTQAVTGI